MTSSTRVRKYQKGTDRKVQAFYAFKLTEYLYLGRSTLLIDPRSMSSEDSSGYVIGAKTYVSYNAFEDYIIVFLDAYNVRLRIPTKRRTKYYAHFLTRHRFKKGVDTCG